MVEERLDEDMTLKVVLTQMLHIAKRCKSLDEFIEALEDIIAKM